MNFISLLVMSSTKMTTQNPAVWKDFDNQLWTVVVSILRARTCSQSSVVKDILFSTWKYLCPHLLVTTSLDGAGLIAVVGLSQAHHQEWDGLNTLTGWSSKTWGCTHPRVGSNLGPGCTEQRWKSPLGSDFPCLTQDWFCHGDDSHLSHSNCTA